MFELIKFAVFSCVNEDAQKAFNPSAINVESELISLVCPFRGPILSLIRCLLFAYL